jgi:hypothetical protein
MVKVMDGSYLISEGDPQAICILHMEGKMWLGTSRRDYTWWMKVFIEHYYIASDILLRDIEIHYVISTHVADSNFFTKTYRGKFLLNTYTLGAPLIHRIRKLEE